MWQLPGIALVTTLSFVFITKSWGGPPLAFNGVIMVLTWQSHPFFKGSKRTFHPKPDMCYQAKPMQVDRYFMCRTFTPIKAFLYHTWLLEVYWSEQEFHFHRALWHAGCRLIISHHCIELWRNGKKPVALVSLWWKYSVGVVSLLSSWKAEALQIPWFKRTMQLPQ